MENPLKSRNFISKKKKMISASKNFKSFRPSHLELYITMTYILVISSKPDYIALEKTVLTDKTTHYHRKMSVCTCKNSQKHLFVCAAYAWAEPG